MHVRTQIRNRLVELLTGLPTTGTNVFPSRIHELSTESLPALSVYTADDEAVEFNTIGYPRQVVHELNVLVEISAVLTNGNIDLLDQIGSEVEKKLTEDNTLAGLVKDCYLTGARSEQEGEVERDHGKCEMSWSITYMIHENDPETLI